VNENKCDVLVHFELTHLLLRRVNVDPRAKKQPIGFSGGSGS
jgi:hypothetical protein